MKFKVLQWYLAHPKYYPEFFILIKRKTSDILFGRQKVNEADVLNWCKKYQRSHEELFKEVLVYVPEETFEETHSSLIAQAKKREETCPVKMGGPGDLNLIYQLCKGKDLCIETGVAYGWSSLSALLSCRRVISVDFPYPGANNEKYVGFVVPPELKKRWILLRLPDSQALPKILKKYKGKADVVHYDSDKSYRGKSTSYLKLWKLLKKGGIFISDDIQHDFAFRDFCRNVGKYPKVVYAKKDYIGVIQK